AFEPFFTTKEVGKGTGLGLSMIYGFVKQSHGHVKIYSELGHGTSIKLFLPRAAADVEREALTKATGAVERTSGNETILVVEDDAGVRTIVLQMLAGLGYRVREAVNAKDSLVFFDAGAPI